VYRRSSGLGAVWNADGTDFSFPWYCDFIATAIAGAPCVPPTAEELAQMQRNQLAKIAAKNPDLAAAGQTLGDSAVAALARANAADAAAYQSSIDSPVLSEWFGTDAATVLRGVDPKTGQPNPSWLNWLMIGGAGLVGFVIVKALIGGR